MECPICYDSLHLKQVVCIPCGHLFHEACLGTHIEQRGLDYDDDVDDDDDEGSAPDCPTCRAPIRRLSKEMMDGVIPKFLHRRIYPAIRKVYLSPPTDDEAERMQETERLWERMETLHREVSEGAEKLAAAEKKRKTAEDKAKAAEARIAAAEGKASAARNKVKELTESLRKEQQRQQVLRNSLAAYSTKKPETAVPHFALAYSGVPGQGSTPMRNLDEEARLLVAQAEQITQPHSASTSSAVQLGRTTTSGPVRASVPSTPHTSQQYTTYGGSQATYAAAHAPSTSVAQYTYGQAAPGNTIPPQVVSYPTAAAQLTPTPVQYYAQHAQVDSQQLQTTTAGSAQMGYVQTESGSSAYVYGTHPSVQRQLPTVSSVQSPPYQSYQPVYSSPHGYAQPQTTYSTATHSGGALAAASQTTAENEQLPQQNAQASNQLQPYTVMEGAGGRPVYVYTASDGRYVYSDWVL